MSEKATKCTCPWQILVLVSQHLDPKSIAKASCVCKTWYISMSSDHIWQNICSNTFTSLANLKLTNPNVPYCKLYGIGSTSSKRRIQKPPKPIIALNNVLFSVDITNRNKHIASVIKHGCDLLMDDEDSIFRFDIDVHVNSLMEIRALDSLRVTWNIVLEDFGGVLSMMDCKGRGSFLLGLEGWFSEELPPPGCCSSVMPSGLVADVRLGLRERCGKVLIEKVSVGVLSVISWRYVRVDDALRYLQHFLSPHAHRC
ncbi:hypothetical protein LIER_17495 [Lithospermum erythrorhizon]|uniref:F-box protein n=1 Tax=Lithospermum erythrorhizon TaxID=34254 RepID=A0AAV3QD24_LITER